MAAFLVNGAPMLQAQPGIGFKNYPASVQYDVNNLRITISEIPSASPQDLGTLFVENPDAGVTYDVQFDSAPPNDNGSFTLGASVLSESLLTAGPLNFEKPVDSDAKNDYVVTVKAVPTPAGTALTRSFTVIVQNANEPPFISAQAGGLPQEVSVQEFPAPLPIAPLEFSAYDQDAGTTLTFEILSVAFPQNAPQEFKSDEAKTLFSIPAVTTSTPTIVDGNPLYEFKPVLQITGSDELKAKYLDYEQIASLTLRVRVIDNGNPSLSSEADLKVSLKDYWQFQTTYDWKIPDISGGLLVETIFGPIDPGADLQFSIDPPEPPNPYFRLPNEAKGDNPLPANRLILPDPSILPTNPTHIVKVRVKDNTGQQADSIISINVNYEPTRQNVDNGTPVLKQIDGSVTTKNLIPVRAIAHGDDGTVYVVGEHFTQMASEAAQPWGTLTVYSRSLTTTQPMLIASNLVATGVAVAGDKLVVVGYQKLQGVNYPRIYWWPLKNLSVDPNDIPITVFSDHGMINPFGTDPFNPGTINGIAANFLTDTQGENGGWRFYICGNRYPDNENVLTEFSFDDLGHLEFNNTEHWSWGPDWAVLNGKTTALTADRFGSVYVAGYWQDPSPGDKSDADKLDVKTGVSGFETLENTATAIADRDFLNTVLPYVVKFERVGPFDFNLVAKKIYQGNPAKDNLLGYALIRDLKMVNSESGDALYALQEFSTATYFGGSYSSGQSPFDVRINRLSVGLELVPGQQGARISGLKNKEAKSFTTDPEGNVYVAGLAQPGGLSFVDGIDPATGVSTASQTGASPGSEQFFVAKLTPQMTWQWKRFFDRYSYTAPSAEDLPNNFRDTSWGDLPVAPAEAYRNDIATAIVSYYPSSRGLLVAGNLNSGILTLVKDNSTNSVAAASGKNAGFLTVLAAEDGEPAGRIFLNIISDYGISNDTVKHVKPWIGSRPVKVGDVITVEALPVLYQDDNGNYYTPEDGDEVIRTRATKRLTCTGLSVGDAVVSSSVPKYTFTVKDATEVTLHWKVEHALEIDSKLEDTGTELRNGVLVKADGVVGLTSKASGNPEPNVNKHWIEDGTIVTAAIDGVVYDTGVNGIRYAVKGYDTTGAAAAPGDTETHRTLEPNLSRAQVLPDPNSRVGFVMRRSATITWRWTPQFRVQQSTTSSRSQDLPGIIDLGDDGVITLDDSGTANVNEADRVFTGSGEFWFNKGAKLIVGAATDSAGSGRTLTGVQFATGDFSPPSTTQLSDLKASFPYTAPNGPSRTYNGSKLTLTHSTSVVWNFGDAIYYQVVTIGNSVAFNTDAALADINRTIAPTVQIIDAPSGSLNEDMQEYDQFDRTSFPVRPGRFFLEWTKNDGSPLVMHITSGFPGKPLPDDNQNIFPKLANDAIRHYRHLTHEEMPPVDLDPDKTDAFYFAGLKYTESDGSVQNGGFIARQPGLHVLLFTEVAAQLPPPAPVIVATGDRTKERLRIRIVETRPWDSPADWASAADSQTGSPMLKTAPVPAVIGTKITSDLDRARINSGFVVYPKARYDANIYDRTVANGGPIIPVNRQFTGKSEDELVIVWYEPSDTDAGAVTPSNLLWPYQSERYPDGANASLSRIKWPDVSSFTTFPNASQPLDRIVIASRLGSEGRNSAHQVQAAFDLLRFDQVRIYNQPDRELAGFNPNEEHALIAPSFKQADLPSPPPTAYALRNDLNVTSSDANYTSDPYVLVEYFDKDAGEFKMAVYSVEKEDHWPDLNPYRYPEMEANLNDVKLVQDDLSASGLLPLQTKSNWVVGDFQNTSEMTFATNVVLVDLAAHANLPPALAARGFGNYFLTRTDPNVISDLQKSPEAGRTLAEAKIADALAAVETALTAAEAANADTGATGYSHRFDKTLQAARRAQARLKATQREFPYTFHYPMKAGEPVQPPYPLPLVIGLTPCQETTGYNPPDRNVYWEDHKGGSWAISQGTFTADVFYPLQPSFWYGEGSSAKAPGECIRFKPEGESLITGRSISPTFAANSSFKINGITVSPIEGTAASFVQAINNSAGLGVQAQTNPVTGQIQLRAQPPGTITLEEVSGTALQNAGLLALGKTSATEGASDRVTYTATWPDVLPILKAGETLTFAGGEYKADYPSPDQPGLPGVVGWAVGRIIYDDLNPTMDNQAAFSHYTAQLISPLEERQVNLKDVASDAEIATFRDLIQPAKQLTKTVGVRWQFTGLSSSLGKRIFFDPFKNTLGLKGFLNDKTLGDSTLTAAPPPIYVLEPDILTGRELDELLKLEKLADSPVWKQAVRKLYELARNPQGIHKKPGSGESSSPYYPGLELDVVQTFGTDTRDADGNLVTRPLTARPRNAFGPGLALVPSPRFLQINPQPQVSYVTLVENNDEELGGPISLFIIKVDQRHRYRGAIKTILSDNVFDEKITLRHTGDFGANADEIVYQWYYREENGADAPLPPSDPWQLFSDQSANSEKGLGMYQITLDGSGGLLLGDNLFFVRYRLSGDKPFSLEKNANSVDWGSAHLADENGNPVPPFNEPVPGTPDKEHDYGTVWNRDGAPFRDPMLRDARGKIDATNPLRFGGEWAGAANSPTVDLEYRPQLVMGWIKRVLDRVNPYEARFNDFRNNESPATYASMIQQAGQPYVGPVALNPDKNVVENVGLIELYQTILDRGVNLSIGLSSPLTTPGINNALLLAATRISDLYMLLANEAYTDSLDPLIGFGKHHEEFTEYGSLTPGIFCFQNQVPSLLDEELALLRGIDDDRRRPMHNRLFWNFTKGEGEVAYALNYNISDANQDGFINESDALIQYPQGHGDAWGHYLTALKTRYRLLKHPFFSWQPRSEFYNLLDVVIDVDFLDERKFAETAAAKAQAGTEIVNMTYRASYVEDPDGQWQGYTDPLPGRDWGVTEWARRVAQGALFDWMTATAIIPAKETDPKKSGIRKVDRSTVTELAKIASNLGSVQNTYDNANSGLNPLGLSSDVVPFDIDPTFLDVGSTAQIGRRAVQGLTHFEQIFERAFATTKNALAAYDYADQDKSKLRQVGVTVDEFRQDVIQQDIDYRNRLIEIFGTPYDGTIGTGKPYPAGYKGPDLSLYMYVDVRTLDTTTVPQPSAEYTRRLNAFAGDLEKVDGSFKEQLQDEFLNPLKDTSTTNRSGLVWWEKVNLTDGMITDLKLPASAGSYTFQALPEWGTRSAPGRLQGIISDMVQTEAEIGLAVGEYDGLMTKLENDAAVLLAKVQAAERILAIKDATADIMLKVGRNIAILIKVKDAVETAVALVKGTFDAIKEASDTFYIAGTANGTDASGAASASAAITAEEQAVATAEANYAAQRTTSNFKSMIQAKKDLLSARNAAAQRAAKEAQNAKNARLSQAKLKAFSKIFDSSASSIDTFVDLAEGLPELAIAIREKEDDKNIEAINQEFDITERIKELQELAGNEGSIRIKIFQSMEHLGSLAGQYRAALAEGFRLVDERNNFNVKTAAATQKNRYQDMAYRTARTQALAKYRASFDLAQKYVYMAAKAYDYETNLGENERGSARPLLNEIIRQRTLGQITDGEPMHGAGGLAEIMATLRDNFTVLEGQLGLNNPQLEANQFSLKKELFGLALSDESSKAAWRSALTAARVPDLWTSQEFRRYCRPFAPRDPKIQEPGIILRFGTVVKSRQNFFGRQLSPGDSAFDPSNFATRIRAAAVKFNGYDLGQLGATPRIYLVPAGVDRMYYPNSHDLQVRDWTIVDQRIPVPFKTGKDNLDDPSWIPVIDSLNGTLGEIRRYSGMGALPDFVGTTGVDDQVYDTRLTARSVWNDGWLLIIPGSTLLADPAAGLDKFINTVGDIVITLQTYGNSGN